MILNSHLNLTLMFILSMLFATATAEQKIMYKKIDKNGRVIFTDKALPGAKKISIDISRNVITRPRTAEESLDETEAKGLPYSIISIEQPANNEIIRDRNGNLYAIVALTPQLSRKHSIILSMDDSPIGEKQKVPYFNLTKVKRGDHQLTAQIVNDETGDIIQTSKSISFRMR